MYKIKTFDSPQDIFILGCDFPKMPETFSLTDDYHLLCIKRGENKLYINTDGYCFILTREEFNNYKDLIVDDESSLEQEGVFIKDFQGDLILKALNSDGEDILSPDFDPREYACFQIIENADFDDIVLELPEAGNTGHMMEVSELIKLL